MKKKTYKIKSSVWIYPGETANWHFVTVPKKESATIKASFGANARGWGSLPVEVLVGKTKWKTSIFPDKKSGTYILPIKAKVRTAEGIMDRDTIALRLTLIV